MGEGLVVVTAILAQVILFERAIHSAPSYDEGVYLASTIDLRAGQALGSDVFAAQPPAFYLGLRLAAAFENSVAGVRTGVLVAFVLGALGVYLLGRSLGGRLGGLLAVALIGLAPPTPLFGIRVLADLPSLWLMFLALGIGAVVCTVRQWQDVTAIAAGVVMAVATFVKPTAVIGIVPLAIVLGRRPDRRRAWIAAGIGYALTTATFLGSYYRHLGALWETIFVYRRRATDLPNLLSTSDILEQTVNPRAAFTWLLGLAVLASVGAIVKSRSLRPLAPLVAPAVLVVLAVGAIGMYRPLHDNHVVLLSEMLAVFAATALGCAALAFSRSTAVVLAVVATVLTVGAYVQAWSRVASEYPPANPAVSRLAARLASVTPEGSLVVSDVPIVAFLAGRETPGNLVDIAELRFSTRTLSVSEILDEIDRRCVSAVVIGRALSIRPGLIRAVARRFERSEQLEAGALYWRRARPCADVGSSGP